MVDKWGHQSDTKIKRNVVYCVSLRESGMEIERGPWFMLPLKLTKETTNTTKALSFFLCALVCTSRDIGIPIPTCKYISTQQTSQTFYIYIYLCPEETCRITSSKGSLEVWHMLQIDWALMFAIFGFARLSRPHFGNNIKRQTNSYNQGSTPEGDQKNGYFFSKKKFQWHWNISK